MIKVKGYRKKGPSNILNILIILMIAIVVVPVATEKIREKSRSDSLLSETDGTLQIEIPLKDKETDLPNLLLPMPPTVTLVRIDDPTQVSGKTLAQETDMALEAESMNALKEELARYISKQDGRYGLYFKNIVTGAAFGINDRSEYIAASTAKLPMNLLLYKKAASDEIDLNSHLFYLQEDFEAGTGIIQNSPYGTVYTVRETARLSIVYSDNCGINMIIRLLGIDNIRRYMQELGGTVYYGSDHLSCPYDLALYAEALYRFYQEEPEIAGPLIRDLQDTQWNDRINKFLPRDVKVSHKIGNYVGVCNDVGIVFAAEPYVLAVMSDGVDQVVASDVIGELSKRIYDHVAAEVIPKARKPQTKPNKRIQPD